MGRKEVWHQQRVAHFKCYQLRTFKENNPSPYGCPRFMVKGTADDAPPTPVSAVVPASITICVQPLWASAGCGAPGPPTCAVHRLETFPLHRGI